MSEAPRHRTGTSAFRDALVEDDPAELYENAPCGYASIHPDGRFLKTNRTFRAWTGHTVEALADLRVHDLLWPGDRIFYETHFAPSLRLQGQVREIAVELRCADDRRLPVLLNAILVDDGAGRPVAIRMAVFDARERRAYEHALLEARREADAAAHHARALATALQQTLLPPTPPHIPGLAIGTAYHPAGDGAEVGGDFYDVFETATGAWGVVIGDVCGKGPAAAARTALARYTVRADAIRSSAPTTVLLQLHDALSLDQQDGFLTAVYLIVTPDDVGARVRMCLAGHHPPLLVRRDGSVEPVGRRGHLLGMLGPPQLYDTDLDLVPGETLLLYTDGVTEARKGDEFYGEDRLRALLAAHADSASQAMAESVAAEILDFQDGRPRDDIAVVALQASG